MKLRIGFIFFVCVALTSVVAPRASFAQSRDKTALLAQFNKTRLDNARAPMAYSAALDKAAQQHADDLAKRREISDIGSDKSTTLSRITAAGFNGWGNTRIFGELYVASQEDNFGRALMQILSDDDQKRILLNLKFREVGIGVARAGGVTYWVVTVGAQPSVLPVFINDGANDTTTPAVAVRLTQEEAVNNAEGDAIGKALEVRLSADKNFNGAAWQRWEEIVPFIFDGEPGAKTLYVQFRDGAGRTTLATANITLDPQGRIALQPLPTSAAPTATLLPSPTPHQTVAPTATAPPAPVAQVVATIAPPPTVAPLTLPATIVPRDTLVPTSVPFAARASNAPASNNWVLIALAVYVVVQVGVIMWAVARFIKIKE
jgi:hypothetical protein